MQFLSATSGVGFTAASFPCFGRAKGGTLVGRQRQTVRLAVTSNGGRSWMITGAPLPGGLPPPGAGVERITATSPADVWAVVGNGRAVATHDGGSVWEVQAIPKPVLAIASEDGVVWAVSCHNAQVGCRPQLWRTRPDSDSWTEITLPRVTAQDTSVVQFAATPHDIIIALATTNARPAAKLLLSHDSGLRWTTRPAPTWDRNQCGVDAALAGETPSTFWLLCLGGGAAGSSTKGLLRSTDAGRAWRTVSAATSLVHPPRPGSIPLEEPGALAAGSQTRLWLSLTNGLAQSNDGGHRWSYPASVNPSGWDTVLDVLDPDHAWLLAPGAGLWRTTDGLNWRAIGPLNTQ